MLTVNTSTVLKGLEVVQADGKILNMMKTLHKDNAGCTIWTN